MARAPGGPEEIFEVPLLNGPQPEIRHRLLLSDARTKGRVRPLPALGRRVLDEAPPLGSRRGNGRFARHGHIPFFPPGHHAVISLDPLCPWIAGAEYSRLPFIERRGWQ